MRGPLHCVFFIFVCVVRASKSGILWSMHDIKIPHLHISPRRTLRLGVFLGRFQKTGGYWRQQEAKLQALMATALLLCDEVGGGTTSHK